MSKVHIDPNIAHTQLDSGSLTMLGAVVRRFEEPGEYRGSVRRGDATEAVFYLSVDKESPVAAANIDLARLAGSPPQVDEGDTCCRASEVARYSVNPRGYVLFHVSGGTGGYGVVVRRADADEKTPVFNSATLEGGAIFSARILRPGSYSIVNARGRARGALSVSSAPRKFSGYRPPPPLRVEVTERGFHPEKMELKPAQGVIFECRAPARIVIEPAEAGEPAGRGEMPT